VRSDDVAQRGCGDAAPDPVFDDGGRGHGEAPVLMACSERPLSGPALSGNHVGGPGSLCQLCQRRRSLDADILPRRKTPAIARARVSRTGGRCQRASSFLLVDGPAARWWPVSPEFVWSRPAAPAGLQPDGERRVQSSRSAPAGPAAQGRDPDRPIGSESAPTLGRSHQPWLVNTRSSPVSPIGKLMTWRIMGGRVPGRPVDCRRRGAKSATRKCELGPRRPCP
jgi:hypothetical protein